MLNWRFAIDIKLGIFTVLLKSVQAGYRAGLGFLALAFVSILIAASDPSFSSFHRQSSGLLGPFLALSFILTAIGTFKLNRNRSGGALGTAGFFRWLLSTFIWHTALLIPVTVIAVVFLH